MTKIIKVRFCGLCPYLEVKGDWNIVNSTEFNCSAIQKEIENLDIIPKWCPLEDSND